MRGDALYELTDVQKSYRGRRVLDIAKLTVREGDILALVGPSGAGKSTLLRLLAFLEQPEDGELRFRNRPVTSSWPDLETRRKVTMVFQRPYLLRRTVRENVNYGLHLRSGDGEEARTSALLAQLGLDELVDARADTLSGGEMQRVALARALILRPEVLLMDEPTANLDPYNIRLIETLTSRTNREDGTTVIVVTHNIFQARRLAQQVGLMINGSLVEMTDADSFFESPKEPETAAFVRGEMIY